MAFRSESAASRIVANSVSHRIRRHPADLGHHVRRRARVVPAYCTAEPARPRVDQEPGIAVDVTVELDEVVSFAERTELPRGVAIAHVLKGARRERHREEALGDRRAFSRAKLVANRNPVGPAREDALEVPRRKRERSSVEPERRDHAGVTNGLSRRSYQCPIRAYNIFGARFRRPSSFRRLAIAERLARRLLSPRSSHAPRRPGSRHWAGRRLALRRFHEA